VAKEGLAQVALGLARMDGWICGVIGGVGEWILVMVGVDESM